MLGKVIFYIKAEEMIVFFPFSKQQISVQICRLKRLYNQYCLLEEGSFKVIRIYVENAFISSKKCLLHSHLAAAWPAWLPGSLAWLPAAWLPGPAKTHWQLSPDYHKLSQKTRKTPVKPRGARKN